MMLCYECAAKVRLAFTRKTLVATGNQKLEKCGNCRKKRYCNELEMVDKEANQDDQH